MQQDQGAFCHGARAGGHKNGPTEAFAGWLSGAAGPGQRMGAILEAALGIAGTAKVSAVDVSVSSQSRCQTI